MVFRVESATKFLLQLGSGFKVASKKNISNLNQLRRVFFFTSPLRASHNYLDIEVSAVDTHARIGRGRESYV